MPLHPVATGSPEVLRGAGWSAQILFHERRAPSLYSRRHVGKQQMDKAQGEGRAPPDLTPGSR